MKTKDAILDFITKQNLNYAFGRLNTLEQRIVEYVLFKDIPFWKIDKVYGLGKGGALKIYWRAIGKLKIYMGLSEDYIRRNDE